MVRSGTIGLYVVLPFENGRTYKVLLLKFKLIDKASLVSSVEASVIDKTGCTTLNRVIPQKYGPHGHEISQYTCFQKLQEMLFSSKKNSL